MRLAFWNDMIETPPQGGYRTFKAGEKHAAIVVRIPWWVAALLRRVISVEQELEPCRIQ